MRLLLGNSERANRAARASRAGMRANASRAVAFSVCSRGCGAVNGKVMVAHVELCACVVVTCVDVAQLLSLFFFSHILNGVLATMGAACSCGG